MITAGVDFGSRCTKIRTAHSKIEHPSILAPPAIFGETKYCTLPKTRGGFY